MDGQLAGVPEGTATSALSRTRSADAGGACVHVDSGDAIHGPGDLWQMIPTNPELFTLRLTGAQISRMLEQSLERSFAGDPLHQQGGYPMRFAGMHVVARVNNPAGARLQQVEIGDSPLNPAREDTVAAAGEQSVEEGSERVMQGIHAVDSVRAYFSVHIPDDHIATPTRFTAI